MTERIPGGGLVLPWNQARPHRCPACHAVAVDMERPRSTRVYTCCCCGSRFARFPRAARFLLDAGVRCSEHRLPDAVLLRWHVREIRRAARSAAAAVMDGAAGDAIFTLGTATGTLGVLRRQMERYGYPVFSEEKDEKEEAAVPDAQEVWRVRWESGIWAPDAVEAARRARAGQMRRNTSACVFEVRSAARPELPVQVIDLEEVAGRKM